MYFKDNVEFVSSNWSLRETALKKLSWIVGNAEGDDEVLLVLLFCGIVAL
jgi:hypothetical protein